MALTAAEKQKRYRAHQKLKPLASGNGNARKTVTNSNGNAPVTEDESVTAFQPRSTSRECAAILRESMTPTFADLPADVQASIEQHCAENNNGARAGSHSRAAMTERALRYQAPFGFRGVGSVPGDEGVEGVAQTCKTTTVV